MRIGPSKSSARQLSMKMLMPNLFVNSKRKFLDYANFYVLKELMLRKVRRKSIICLQAADNKEMKFFIKYEKSFSFRESK